MPFVFLRVSWFLPLSLLCTHYGRVDDWFAILLCLSHDKMMTISLSEHVQEGIYAQGEESVEVAGWKNKQFYYYTSFLRKMIFGYQQTNRYMWPLASRWIYKDNDNNPFLKECWIASHKMKFYCKFKNNAWKFCIPETKWKLTNLLPTS